MAIVSARISLIGDLISKKRQSQALRATGRNVCSRSPGRNRGGVERGFEDCWAFP